MLSRKEIQDKLKEVLLNADPQKKDIQLLISDRNLVKLNMLLEHFLLDIF